MVTFEVWYQEAVDLLNSGADHDTIRKGLFWIGREALNYALGCWSLIGSKGGAA
jgi:hypothetical protein